MRRLVRAVRRRLQAAPPAEAAPAAPEPAPPPPPLRPALVIPVHNDADGLARLLAQVHRLGCFAQIVVVDDGSTPPVAPATDITLLRHETAQGGGVARNLGLTAVTAPHVLFFDADDLLTDELPHLLDDLGGAGDFDFCHFKYADSRVPAEGLWGHPDWDEALWERAGASVGPLRTAPPDSWPTLAQTANYPWNKLYRTAFLRDHAVGCAATQVHQDVPLHWLGYLAATRVLTSDRICAWHGVQAGGGRLTNRTGTERLEVFAALTPVAKAAAGKGVDWQTALVRFALGLVDWGADAIRSDLVPSLRAQERDWLRAHMAPWQEGITAQDPALGAQLTARLHGTAEDPT